MFPYMDSTFHSRINTTGLRMDSNLRTSSETLDSINIYWKGWAFRYGTTMKDGSNNFVRLKLSKSRKSPGISGDSQIETTPLVNVERYTLQQRSQSSQNKSIFGSS